MTAPSENSLVEKPIIEQLTSEYGYHYIPPNQHGSYRGDRENEVIFTPLLEQAIIRINQIPETAASAIVSELQGITDNERWLNILRGDFSRKIEGEASHRNIKLVDYDSPANNHFAVTNQLKISGAKTSIPDLIIYLNGIPVVVIEAKTPLKNKRNTWSGVDQIRQYEANVPRLFAANLFNIATNDRLLLYGATATASAHWTRWRDPWPRKATDFFDESAKILYALLSPERLLDILAHFIIFESRAGKREKKMCRYQQYRAVKKMEARVQDEGERQGLIWHTQGSGKSLTMVYGALKFKYHRGSQPARLSNPNLVVITDRKDLHRQISSTFAACGLANPQEARSAKELRTLVSAGVLGRTVLTTIYKFKWETEGLKSRDQTKREAALAQLEVPGSENWILMVDEAHRTQEKDLGAYLRAILPKAVRFGFTGTPVKKGDKDTYKNFSNQGEGYLDKYGISDAILDEATVPVYYQGRLTEWHLKGKWLDIHFDQAFANETPEVLEEIKARSVTRGDLARYGERIELVSYDIWNHYHAELRPDGFKAQIVAIDRLACVCYKKALDAVIEKHLIREQQLSKEAASEAAKMMSCCVYSAGQHDQEQHPELLAYQLDEQGEKEAIANFKKAGHPLVFLIVCNKLLTGFDAPIEQALYLDSPLTDHNLLQAIARTNRRYGTAKTCGKIVDYIGVSSHLGEALAAYHAEDIQAAMTDDEELFRDLQRAHGAVMDLLVKVLRTGEPKTDVQAAIGVLHEEDSWYEFQGKASEFIKRYGAMSPDKRILQYQDDLKFIGALIPYGKQYFEADTVEVDWRQYSKKIREILSEHLEVTGLTTVIKLRSMTDPSFWQDFKKEGKDLVEAAVRKLTELKKEIGERSEKNEARYGKFSERIQQLIERFQKGLIEGAEAMNEAREIAEELDAEDKATQASELSHQAYNVYKILQSKPQQRTEEQEAAEEIDALYQAAPALWQIKNQTRKELTQKVRRIVRALGHTEWKKVSVEIDAYAVKSYGE